MSLFVFTICVFAITYIVGHSRASLPIRKALDRPGLSWTLALIECCACLGFWVSTGAFFLHLAPAELHTWWVAALYGCGTSLILAKYTGLMEE